MKLKLQWEKIIIQGKTISLSEYRVKGEPVKFYNMDIANQSVSTDNWNEGDSHITTVVDATETGIVVISWGHKYLIPYECLTTNNVSFAVTEFVKKGGKYAPY